MTVYHRSTRLQRRSAVDCDHPPGSARAASSADTTMYATRGPGINERTRAPLAHGPACQPNGARALTSSKPPCSPRRARASGPHRPPKSASLDVPALPPYYRPSMLDARLTGNAPRADSAPLLSAHARRLGPESEIVTAISATPKRPTPAGHRQPYPFSSAQTARRRQLSSLRSTEAAHISADLPPRAL